MFISKYTKLDWPLKTNRILIQGLSAADKNEVFEIVKYEEVAKNNPWTSPKTVETFDFKWAEEQPYKHAELAFRLIDTGELIGSGGLYIDEENHKARLGYIIHPDFWNRGYMTEVVDKLLEVAFIDLELHRVEATVYSGNIGSTRVLEKNGFQYEGRQRDAQYVKGKFITLDMYGLVQEVWKSKYRIGEIR